MTRLMSRRFDSADLPGQNSRGGYLTVHVSRDEGRTWAIVGIGVFGGPMTAPISAHVHVEPSRLRAFAKVLNDAADCADAMARGDDATQE